MYNPIILPEDYIIPEVICIVSITEKNRGNDKQNLSKIHLPVEPKPPAERWVSDNTSVSS